MVYMGTVYLSICLFLVKIFDDSEMLVWDIRENDDEKDTDTESDNEENEEIIKKKK